VDPTVVVSWEDRGLRKTCATSPLLDGLRKFYNNRGVKKKDLIELIFSIEFSLLLVIGKEALVRML
jgi:hypothetical protein